MSSFPKNSFRDDDISLTAFLKQHRPRVPSAHPGLEDRVLTVIESVTQEDVAEPVPTTIPFRKKIRLVGGIRQRVWWMSGAIAAGMVAAISGYHTLLRPNPSELELAELETFIEHTYLLEPDSSDPHTALEEGLFPVTEPAGLN